ncbi:MAG: type I toxin-antitoxin system toxin Ldr family protein [Klebsiella michiganensis]|nr:type I toxin-antitoxin system toxin Ldr family protein [Klebsiella michiganensis]
MTLAQLGLVLWDDLAAPVIAALVAACARTGPQG